MKIDIEAEPDELTTLDPETRKSRVIESRTSWVSFQDEPDAVTVELDLPGAHGKDLDISLSGRRLMVRWESTSEDLVDEGGRRRTVTTETVKKEVDLPPEVDAGSATAILKRGVLSVRISKLASDDEGETIPIKMT